MDTVEALSAKIEQLNGRVAELEEALRQSERVMQALIDHVPGHVYVNDLQRRYTVVNRVTGDYAGGREHIIGKEPAELYPTEIVAGWYENDRRILETGITIDAEESAMYEDGVHTHRSIKFPIRDGAGNVCAIGGISLDITAQRRAEQEQGRLQAAIIEAQRAAIQELSTPIIPLSSSAVVVPLIGTMDTMRAQQLMEALLEGVATRGASVVIIDVTGVRTIDTRVAQALIQSARAVRLLGAQVVMTGIQPAIAQALVQLEVDFHGIVVHRSLQAGIEYALASGNGQRRGHAQ